MKRIMVTTDFSPLGDRAIAGAGEMARQLESKLFLVHVQGGERPPVPDPDAPYFKVAQRLYQADAELEAQALSALEERGKLLEGLEWKAVLGRGEPVEGILRAAKEEEADLIVISSQGRTGFKRLLLGSVAEGLARESLVPILIWKEIPPSSEAD